jgi:hypothetical protein
MKLEDIASEYQGASPGDPRRSRRMERIAQDLARDPGLSFPEAMGNEGQLEGLYRFLNNDKGDLPRGARPARRANATALPGPRARVGSPRHDCPEVQR